MALVEATHLETSGSNSDSSTYTTGSISPTPNRLILLAIVSQTSSATPNEPTPTLSGWTFTKINTTTYNSGDVCRTTLFRAFGSGTGTIGIAFGGQTQKGCLWSMSQFKNTKKTGTNGADSIVQSGTAQANSGAANYTITLGAFSDTSNATFSCVGKPASNDVSPGSGFSELGETTISSPTFDIESMWKNSNDTSVDASFVGSGGDAYGAIAVEIAYASESSGFLNFM